VDADLDTLATALYVRTDDLLKDHPRRIPWRPAVGIAPMISDAEVVTLSVIQALLAAVGPIDQSEERPSSIFTALCVGAVDADPELPVDVGHGRWSKQFDQLLLGSHAELAEDGG